MVSFSSFTLVLLVYFSVNLNSLSSKQVNTVQAVIFCADTDEVIISHDTKKHNFDEGWKSML